MALQNLELQPRWLEKNLAEKIPAAGLSKFMGTKVPVHFPVVMRRVTNFNHGLGLSLNQASPSKRQGHSVEFPTLSMHTYKK
jgi:hypothetical protein